MSTTATLATVLPNLLATAPHALSFAPGTVVRSYLLRRPGGNLLVYGTGELAAAAPALEEAGGVAHHLLGHEHEAAFLGGARPAPLAVHERDAAAARAAGATVDATFSERHALREELEAIPIPGHTPGSTAYLWDQGEHRVLFTADSLYVAPDGAWRVAVLDSSDPDAYAASLELLRELEFDVLAPWAMPAGAPSVVMTDRADARRRIDEALARVRAGARS